MIVNSLNTLRSVLNFAKMMEVSLLLSLCSMLHSLLLSVTSSAPGSLRERTLPLLMQVLAVQTSRSFLTWALQSSSLAPISAWFPQFNWFHSMHAQSPRHFPNYLQLMLESLPTSCLKSVPISYSTAWAGSIVRAGVTSTSHPQGEAIT